MLSSDIQLNIRTSREFRSLLRFLADEFGLSMNKFVEAAVVEYVEVRLRTRSEFRNKAIPLYEPYVLARRQID